MSEPRIRILAVDDEADLLELNKLFLERSGELEVRCCTSVTEALDLLNLEQFDAVVSDYQMPEADGISFLRSLRESGNGIPFILFTGKGREDVVIQALNNGADFYLQKGGSPTPMYAELEHKLKVAVERRRQTLELHENRNRFRMVLEKLPIGLWLADRDGKLVLGNPAGQRIWGGHPRVGQDEYGVFKAWRLPQRERIQPDDWALGYAVNEGRETDWELLEIEAFDGSRKTIYNWATPLKNEDDDIIGAFVINQEITKEVEALKALEASERRYRTYVERSPFGLFIADGAGHYLEVNEAACRITGYSREELTSMSVLDLQNEETLPEARSHFERALRDGVSSGETRFVHKSGGIRHWFVEAVVLSPDRIMAFVQDVTGRKMLERSLLLKERAVESATSGIVLFTLDNRFSYANERALEILGLSDLSEIIGKSSVEFHAHGSPRIEMIEQIMKGETWKGEVPLIKKGGGHIIVDMSIHLISGEDGEPLAIMSSIHDITERKRAEEELREAEAKYRELVQNSNDLIYRIEFLPEQRFTYVNPASTRLTGYTPEDHYADPMLGFKLVHPDDRPELLRMMENNLFNEPIQLRWVRKDGRVVWTEQHNVPIYDADGKLVRLEGVARDITERKMMEDVLRRNEETYRSILTHADMAIAFFGLDGRFLFVNSLSAKILGGKAEEFVGRSLQDVLGERIGRIYLERITLAAGSVDVQTYEDHIPLPTGERWFVSIFSRVIGSDGSVEGVHVISLDINERKMMELALRSANHKLNLLSSLTRHELSNQLMVQMSSLTLMAMKQERGDQDLERALEAGRRIDSIIKFSRDYEDLGANAPRWHRLSNLLRAVFADRGGRADVQMDVPEDLEIFTDDLIRKVFVNLVENALMHGEHVTRMRSWTEKDGDDLLIFLSDDGIGVPDELKERIFERGFGKNTGQGLFLTREVLDLTGMRIDEVGESGKGAVFRITVPPRSYRLADS